MLLFLFFFVRWHWLRQMHTCWGALAPFRRADVVVGEIPAVGLLEEGGLELVVWRLVIYWHLWFLSLDIHTEEVQVGEDEQFLEWMEL